MAVTVAVKRLITSGMTAKGRTFSERDEVRTDGGARVIVGNSLKLIMGAECWWVGVAVL